MLPPISQVKPFSRQVFRLTYFIMLQVFHPFLLYMRSSVLNLSFVAYANAMTYYSFMRLKWLNFQFGIVIWINQKSYHDSIPKCCDVKLYSYPYNHDILLCFEPMPTIVIFRYLCLNLNYYLEPNWPSSVILFHNLVKLHCWFSKPY